MYNEIPTSEPKGLLHSISAFAGTLLAIVHNRLALLSIDLIEAKSELLSLLAMVLVAVFCLATGLILAAISFVTIFWDTHRILALVATSGFFLICSVIIFIVVTNRARTSRKLFETSLYELYKDVQHLKSRS